MGDQDATAPDFAAMYRELGLDASCSIEALRIARRRRIARLHPDLAGAEADTARLQRLNRAYAAAIAFHARFGRLPGAPPPGRAAPTVAVPADDAARPGAGAAAAPRWRRAAPPAESHRAAGLGTMSRYPMAARAAISVALAGVAVALATAVVRQAASDAPASVPAKGTRGAPGTAIAGPALAPGMDQDTVRKTLGEPLEMHAQRWQYGPSWVEFRCDRVAGWHSAAERPLPVDVATLVPPADAEGPCE